MRSGKSKSRGDVSNVVQTGAKMPPREAPVRMALLGNLIATYTVKPIPREGCGSSLIREGEIGAGCKRRGDGRKERGRGA